MILFLRVASPALIRDQPEHGTDVGLDTSFEVGIRAGRCSV